jgi:biopolymer transport protein ExbB
MGAARAETLDDLLKQVQQAASEASKSNQQREAAFARAKDQQAALLAQAEAELAQAEARANAVKAQFDANQAEIAALKEQLTSQSSEFTQVFAGIKQGVADIRPLLADSMIAPQYPKRLVLVDQLANATAQPTIPELQQFWLALQQELVGQGKVERLNLPVDGKPEAVVRVGAFAAFTPDHYLRLSNGTLQKLPRQPESPPAVPSGAGEVDFLIDPSRGSLLSLTADRPTLEERIHQGGWIGYVIIAVGALGFALAVFQAVYLSVVSALVARQRRDLEHPQSHNPLGRVLSVLKKDAGQRDPEILELRLSEAVLREIPKLERFQGLIRLIIAAGPLLGLLGTVAGMIETFQVIMEVGSSDPKVMAGGISAAMIATVLGLFIAIPLLFVNAGLSSLSRALVQLLDEQSAGLLAARLEREA